MFVSRTKTAFLILIAFIFFFALLWNHPEVAQADDEPAPWDHIVDVVAGEGFTVGLRDDGRVAFAGDNFSEDIWKIADWRDIKRIEVFENGYISYIVGYGKGERIRLASLYGYNSDHKYITKRWTEEEFSDWHSVKQLIIDDGMCAGLRNDGTVIAMGEYLTEDDLMNIATWEDIVQVIIWGGVIGVRSDGTIEHTNWKQMADFGWDLDAEWNDIKQIQFGIVPDQSDKPYGIKLDGTVLGLERDEVKYDGGGATRFFEPEEVRYQQLRRSCCSGNQPSPWYLLRPASGTLLHTDPGFLR